MQSETRGASSLQQLPCESRKDLTLYKRQSWCIFLPEDLLPWGGQSVQAEDSGVLATLPRAGKPLLGNPSLLHCSGRVWEQKWNYGHISFPAFSRTLVNKKLVKPEGVGNRHDG